MRRSPIFAAYGATLLMLFAAAEYTGYGFMGPSAARGGPKTIRDNPGASRSHYGGIAPRYVGGK
ncbi:MAG TPA: hypothetical protein VGL53_16415 [Bryobacteraceae bacterium]|jgi:hypothetical protein